MQNSGADFVELGPATTLEILFNRFSECTKCQRSGEREKVADINWGAGGKRAELAIISSVEISDKEERELLEKMIAAMGLSLDDVYITSVVKCETKEPGFSMDDALTACKHFLLRELELVSPKVAVVLGIEAAKTLIETPLAFDSIRGRFQGCPSPAKTPFQIMPTHQLKELVGSKERKKESWGDLKKVMAKLKLAPVK
jgi:DNA polymerase